MPTERDPDREKRVWSLQAFPVAIDPATNVLEIQARQDKPPDTWPKPHALPWTQLQRLTVAHDTFNFPILNIAPNLYGTDADISQCNFALAYTSTGYLYSLLFIEDGEWYQTEFAEEITGRRPAMSSVRVMFPVGQDALDFVEALRRLRLDVHAFNNAGNPEDERCILRTLVGNAEPARLINVAKL